MWDGRLCTSKEHACHIYADDCHLFVFTQITADARARFINPRSYILSSLRLAGVSCMKSPADPSSDVSGNAYSAYKGTCCGQCEHLRNLPMTSSSRSTPCASWHTYSCYAIAVPISERQLSNRFAGQLPARRMVDGSVMYLNGESAGHMLHVVTVLLALHPLADSFNWQQQHT